MASCKLGQNSGKSWSRRAQGTTVSTKILRKEPELKKIERSKWSREKSAQCEGWPSCASLSQI